MTADVEPMLLAGFLAFCRIGGCFLLMPGLLSVRVPLQIRLFVALSATVALLVHLWDQILPFVDRRPQVLLPMILSETLVGALIGLTVRLYTLALSFIASAIAMLMGFNGIGGSAVEEAEPQASVASLITFSALLLLFVFDFHHEIVRALVASYSVAPLNIFLNPQSALIDLTDTLSEAFFVMVRLGSPFVAYALLVNLTVGFVNKLTPQIPVYFISLPFVVAGGLILLYFGAPTLLSLFADGFAERTIGR